MILIDDYRVDKREVSGCRYDGGDDYAVIEAGLPAGPVWMM
jgi:hypothetical protein